MPEIRQRIEKNLKDHFAEDLQFLNIKDTSHKYGTEF